MFTLILSISLSHTHTHTHTHTHSHTHTHTRTCVCVCECVCVCARACVTEREEEIASRPFCIRIKPWKTFLYRNRKQIMLIVIEISTQSTITFIHQLNIDFQEYFSKLHLDLKK